MTNLAVEVGAANLLGVADSSQLLALNCLPGLRGHPLQNTWDVYCLFGCWLATIIIFWRVIALADILRRTHHV